MKWMTFMAMTLMLLGAGCTSVVSDRAICDGTFEARAAHAAALALDGGDRSVLTGADLIGALDAGCGEA